MKRICCIYKRIIFSNNEIVYRISSGSPAKKSDIFFEDFVEWSSVKDRGSCIEYTVNLMMEDGTTQTITSFGIRSSYIIDSKYVMLVFFEDNDKFIPPNNAAVYNAAGELLQQLESPKNEQGWYIHSIWCEKVHLSNSLGVYITNDKDWPALCFCKYTGDPKLSYAEETVQLNLVN
jgi:hypothetical protein